MFLTSAQNCSAPEWRMFKAKKDEDGEEVNGIRNAKGSEEVNGSRKTKCSILEDVVVPVNPWLVDSIPV